MGSILVRTGRCTGRQQLGKLRDTGMAQRHKDPHSAGVCDFRRNWLYGNEESIPFLKRSLLSYAHVPKANVSWEALRHNL